MTEEAIISTLEEQVGLYRRLAKLAELQHEHVQQGRIEELLDVLGKRQDVVNRLTPLDSMEEARSCPRAMELIREARELLTEITEADKRDSLVLQQRKLNLGTQIGKTRSAGQVNRHYASSAYGKSESKLDVKGM